MGMMLLINGIKQRSFYYAVPGNGLETKVLQDDEGWGGLTVHSIEQVGHVHMGGSQLSSQAALTIFLSQMRNPVLYIYICMYVPIFIY